MIPDYCELDPDGDVILILERWHEEDEGVPPEAPAEDAPPEDAPAEDWPPEEAPAEEAPAEDWPPEEAPAEEAPAEDWPPEEAPAEEAPAEDWPPEEAPAEEAPIEEAPAEEAPAEEAPIEEAPAEEAPAEEAPAEEAPEWIELPEAEEVPVDDPLDPMEETAETVPAHDPLDPMEETAEAVPAHDPPAPTGETLTGEVLDSEKRPKSEHMRIRVSSKHLILASPCFRSMLQGDFDEIMDLRTTGAAEISLVGDHPPALLILLNIIHGHTREVPRDVNFRMLTQIAILVHKYQLHEVAEMFTDTWVEKLKGSMPTSLTDDLRAAICIYWVFRKSSKFKRATQIALMNSNDRIEGDGMPIPDSVFDKIDSDRQNAFQQCFSTLRGILEEYHEPGIKCHQQRFECDAMVYGGLILRLRSIGYFPLPDSPYRNLRWKDVSQKLRGMHVPTFCDHVCRRRSYSTQKCVIDQRIVGSVNSLQELIEGLDLESFRNGERS